jgi:hypothetical protein
MEPTVQIAATEDARGGRASGSARNINTNVIGLRHHA